MPLPIAHGLLGASLAAALYPEPTKRYFAPLLVGAFLANAPDFDFLFVFIFDSKAWHRGFTHSITLAVIVFAVFLWYYGRQHWREATAFGLAFASHGFLDFVTTTGVGGLKLFAPFSNERFALGWFSLSEAPSKLTVLEIVRVLGIEFLIFAPLLLLILVLRSRFAKRHSFTEEAV
jgi:membrane-bound metal-dependent hydrolase YbcI (DUF457 family)